MAPPTNRIALLMVSLLVGALLVGNQPSEAQALAVDAVNADDIQYPVDPAALHEEFRQTGHVTLLAPRVGALVVTGQENNLTSEAERAQHPYLHLLGTAVGHPGSDANILIGEYAVYGTVELSLAGEQTMFGFDAVEPVPGIYQQRAYVITDPLPLFLRDHMHADEPEDSSAADGNGTAPNGTADDGPLGNVTLPDLTAAASLGTDSSGNGNDATITGPSSVLSVYQDAVAFHGSGDYARVNSPSLPSGDFTYMAWIKPISGKDLHMFMAADGGGGNEIIVKLLPDHRIGLWLDHVKYDATVSGTAVPSGEWSHVAITRSGGTVTTFINGAFDRSGTATSTTLGFSSCPLLMGTDVDSGCTGSLGNWASGSMDEARIYNRALSSSEVVQAMAGKAVWGLVGHWRFDTAGGQGTDSSGNGHHATLYGPTYSQNVFPNALYFDGSGDYLRAPASVPSNDFTYMAWVKPVYLKDFHMFMAADGSGNNEIIVKLLPDHRIGLWLNHVKYDSSVSGSWVPDAEWSHIAVKRSGSTVTTYINGKVDRTSTVTSVTLSTTCEVLLGTDADSGCTGSLGNWASGSMDEARIYNRALSTSEVVDAMVGHPSASGLLGEWKFEHCLPPGASEAATNGPGASTPAAVAPDPCQDPPNCAGGMATSLASIHAEASFTNAHANWYDRILSARAQYDPLWDDLCIDLLTSIHEVGYNIIGSNHYCNSGTTVRHQYSQWLEDTWQYNTGDFFDADAYQLWTGVNLKWSGAWYEVPEEAYCFGVAVSDRVNIERTAPDFTAASVVEGVDDPGVIDTYDPDEVHERGIVSGHEFAHTYGEENHPCGGNMMTNGVDPGNRDLLFAPESKQEIMFRFHYKGTGTDFVSISNENGDCS